jgi:hypothetical protein
MATFSNLPLTLAGQNSQTYLMGTISNDPANGFDTNLYVQGIRSIYGGLPPINQFGPFPFFPVAQTANLIEVSGGIASGRGLPSVVAAADPFANPASVRQQGFRPGGTPAAPNLYVGDNRPHNVFFREGHLYEARVGSAFQPAGVFPGGPLSTTVFYDITQKLRADLAGFTVLSAKWQNVAAYAPMFEVPANVKIYGVVTPSGILSYLEKLFVATTNPPLSGFPDTTFNAAIPTLSVPPGQVDPFPGAGDPRSRETFGATGIAPTQLPAVANCYNYQINNGAPLTNGGTPVGTNPTNNIVAWASLFDIRCGQDVIDTNPQFKNPQSGVSTGTYMYTIRGGASLDPNDGSVWAFGAYAQKRNTGVSAIAHWGTMAANYKLTAPPTQDEYGNATNLYTDIGGNGAPKIPEYDYILMAANVGLGPNLTQMVPNATAFPFVGVNTTLYPAGSTAGITPPGNAPALGTFGPDDFVTRREMAYWIVKAQMDEGAIDLYLANAPALNGVTGTGPLAQSFSDVPPTDKGYRYIEVMARRGYTSGCGATDANGVGYCPDRIATRKDMAVFMIRAKFSNVFPSVISGCALNVAATTPPPPGVSFFFPPAFGTNCVPGDNFGFSGLPFFDDNPIPTTTALNAEYAYIQKLRELRVTNGTSLGPKLDGRNGHYARGPFVFSSLPANDPVDGTFGYLRRKQVAVFIMRAFFF